MLRAQDIIARAAAFAALHAKPPAPLGRLAPVGPVQSADAVARKMADDMLDIAAVKGGAEEDDLLGRGWSLEALRRHGPAARDIANQAAERVV